MFKKLRQYLDNLVTLKDIEDAADSAVNLGYAAANGTFTAMWKHFFTYRDVTTYDSGHQLLIICPDCGKQVAHKNRCPKCASASWVPAGHAGGVHERMRIQRWRELAVAEDEGVVVEFAATA